MNRGEVWWLEHPEIGRRPACILTRQHAIPVVNAVLVAPATRTIRGMPTELLLSLEDGMPSECVLSFDNLMTVSKAFLTERITSVATERLDEICAALAAATGC